MDFTTRNVNAIVQARKNFQEKLTQDLEASSQRKAENSAKEEKTGFLKRPEPEAVASAPADDLASLRTTIPAGPSTGSTPIKALHVPLDQFDAPNNELMAAAQAIKDIESSGGNYQARGPVVKSGMYTGQRAMGAYQVMPGNLPQWSKSALGREVTEEEFLSDMGIQDSIFLDQFTKSYKKHGNFNDAASIWFTGETVEKGRGRTDGQMTSEDYLKGFTGKFNRYLNEV